MSQLFFKKPLQIAVREGRKRTTIRRWKRPRVTGGGRSYAPGLGWLAIERVEQVELANLNDDDARADGFETHVEMMQVLAELYPDAAGDGKVWFRVTFRLEQGK